jgi:hypothetical protein
MGRKSKKTKHNPTGTQPQQEAASQNKFSTVVKAICGGVIVIITTFGLVDRYSKHEELEVDLQEVIYIISESDSKPADSSLETGWLLSRIDKKLHFIRAAQLQAHNSAFLIHGTRFDETSAWSYLPVLKSADKTFHSIEKDSHSNYSQLRAKAQWKIAMEKTPQDSNLNIFSKIPITMLSSISEISDATAKSLSMKTGSVSGVFVRKLPTSLNKGNYPVIDLNREAVRQTLQKSQISPPNGARYFVPAAPELTEIEGSENLPVFFDK